MILVFKHTLFYTRYPPLVNANGYFLNPQILFETIG